MKLGRLLLIGRFKKRKRRRKEIREFSFLKTNLGIEGEIFFFGAARIGGFFAGEKHRRSGKRLIAIKAVQVCFSLLLKLLPMFDFSVCFSFQNI